MQLLLGYVLVFAAFIGYYYVMETKFQRTVGKFGMTKTKVVQMDGTQPSNGTILVRTLSRLLPFDRLSYLFVKNGLHDYLSKNYGGEGSEGMIQSQLKCVLTFFHGLIREGMRNWRLISIDFLWYLGESF